MLGLGVVKSRALQYQARRGFDRNAPDRAASMCGTGSLARLRSSAYRRDSSRARAT